MRESADRVSPNSAARQTPGLERRGAPPAGEPCSTATWAGCGHRFPRDSAADFYVSGTHFLGALRGDHHDIHEFAVFADEFEAFRRTSFSTA
jgi:hypothetical protein